MLNLIIHDKRATNPLTIGTDRVTRRKPPTKGRFELSSATRAHEVGIASNRGSARRGETTLSGSAGPIWT